MLNYILPWGFLFFCGGSNAYLTGTIINEGALTCHNRVEKDKKGNDICCEASGVAYLPNQHLVFVTDWWNNDYNNLFYYPWDGYSEMTGTATQWQIPLINQTRKVEDLTLTQDGRYLIAAASFAFQESFDPNPVIFNRLVSVSLDHLETAHEINFRDADGIFLRRWLLAEINKKYPNSDYMKIESIATLPDDRLLLATREIGKSYKDFEYRTLLFTLSYIESNGYLILNYDLNFLAEITFNHPEVPEGIGLSSLTYDKYHDRLLAVTTFEQEGIDAFSSYLWELHSNDQFTSTDQLRIHPVYTDSGSVLQIPYKIEGIDFVTPSKVILVADQDKLSTSARKTYGKNQAPWLLLELNESVIDMNWMLFEYQWFFAA